MICFGRFVVRLIGRTCVTIDVVTIALHLRRGLVDLLVLGQYPDYVVVLKPTRLMHKYVRSLRATLDEPLSLSSTHSARSSSRPAFNLQVTRTYFELQYSKGTEQRVKRNDFQEMR